MVHHAVGVVGHAKRIDTAQKLADDVEAKVLSIDPGRLGAGRNHLRVWQELYRTFGDAKWLVVLEDDAVPIKDFRRQLRMALDVCPTPVASLYLGRYRPGHWQPSIGQAFGMIDPAIHSDPPDPCWFTGMGVLHAVALAVKTSLVPVMVDSVRMNLRNLPIDEAISLWAWRRGAEVAYSMPSLVDHDHTLPTVISDHRTGLYPSDAGVRMHDLRRAWRVGARPSWNSSMLVVPQPQIKDDAYVIL